VLTTNDNLCWRALPALSQQQANLQRFKLEHSLSGAEGQLQCPEGGHKD